MLLLSIRFVLYKLAIIFRLFRLIFEHMDNLFGFCLINVKSISFDAIYKVLLGNFAIFILIKIFENVIILIFFILASIF